MTTSGMQSMPDTDEEWHKLIDDVLERRSNSYVQAAMMLAHRFVIDERYKKQLSDNLSLAQERCTQLLEQRRALCAFIEELAKAPADERDQLIAGMVSSSRAMQ
jgi:hypothetical protein